MVSGLFFLELYMTVTVYYVVQAFCTLHSEAPGAAGGRQRPAMGLSSDVEQLPVPVPAALRHLHRLRVRLGLGSATDSESAPPRRQGLGLGGVAARLGVTGR